MEYAIEELAKKSKTSITRIRRYIGRGFLPYANHPNPDRPSIATYGDAHLLRLLALARLRREHIRLGEASRRIEATDLAGLYRYAGLEPPKVEPTTVPPPPPVEVKPPKLPAPGEALGWRASRARPREHWEHITLCPGVELRVRADADTEARRVAAEIEAAWSGTNERSTGG